MKTPIATKKSREEWVASFEDEYALMCDTLGPYIDGKNYAGREGDWKSRFIPKRLYGINLNPVFYRHDGFYTIGGDKSDRWRADCTMLCEGLLFIRNYPDKWYIWGFNTARRRAAERRMLTYFDAVRDFGSDAFNFHEKELVK